MKLLLFITMIISVAAGRRSMPIPANNVHRMGWGLDDDVYFAEPQEVSTFQSEHDVQTVKPVKRVVKQMEPKVSTKLPERKVSPWGLPKLDDIEDLIGLE